MGNIIELFGAVIVLGLICVGIVALLYPIMFEIKFKETFGKNGISYWWTVIQMIGMLGTISSEPEEFGGALGFTIIIFFIAMIRNYKRIQKMELDRSICWMAVLAQAMAPIGVFLILILISSLFKEVTDDEKR